MFVDVWDGKRGESLRSSLVGFDAAHRHGSFDRAGSSVVHM